ncbi:MAG: MMPL family transporter [Thermomicrobiales bacterium]
MVSTGSISRYVLANKRLVLAIWLVVFAIGLALVSPAIGQLSTSFEFPGTESADANGRILERYGNGALTDPLVPVVTLPEGTTVDTAGVCEELAALDAMIAERAPNPRIVSWVSTGDDAFVSEDRRTVFSLVYLPYEGEGLSSVTPELEEGVASLTVGGSPVWLSGTLELISGEAGAAEEEEGGVLAETLISAAGALIVLLYIFGSALAILPLIIAAVSIITTFLVIGGIASFMDINTVVQYLVALIGLGIAIDYALLVVTRWREERAAGFENELAVQRAMETAGHAVVFSGSTVGVGLIAIVVLPVPFLRGIGIGGLIIPVISIIVTLTLLPVILATIGPRLDWPRFRRRTDSGAGWRKWSTFVVKHRWATAIIASVIVLGLLIPATQLEIGAPRPDSLNGTGNAQLGLEALETSGIDSGVMTPLEVVVDGDANEVLTSVAGTEGMRAAVVTGRADAPVIAILPQDEGSASDHRELLDRIRTAIDPLAGQPQVGGGIAGSADFSRSVYGNFIWMALAIAIVTYILLIRAFRSIILPAKALLLNIVSVGAAYGVLVLVWQYGWGSSLIWDIPSTGSITDWIPVMVFAFLFGLSMDYEVFIMARMREEYDSSKDTDDAVIRGLSLTGRLVTCAALILFLAFVSLASAPVTELKIMATGLAAGILIDATIIRAMLVPALVSLMGHWNWWLPSWLERFVPHPEPMSGDPAR